MTASTRDKTGPAAEQLNGVGRATAIAAGVTAIGMAIYQVATEGPPDDASYETWSDWTREGLFLAYLLTSIVAVLTATRARLAPPVGARLVAAGYTLITIGVTAGLVTREELDWFFAVAGPGLLLSAAGFITWAIWTRKHAITPGWVSLLIGVGGVLAIFLSEVGTSVLIGSAWLYLANRNPDD